MMFIVEIDPVIHITFTLLVIVIFVSASLHKLFSLSTFKVQLDNYQILPKSLVPLVAVAVPYLELGATLLFVNPATRNIGGIVLGTLMSIYTAAIGINLYRGRTEVDCGCLGSGKQLFISPWLLIRNAVIIGLILFTSFEINQRLLSWIDGVTIISAVITLVALYWVFNNLLANQSLLKSL